jgi:orotidine-5'-phosphate decarboxylase
VETTATAVSMARRLQGSARILKIGSQLFTAEGPAVVEKIAGLGFEIFLDLKFHDIPNTVWGAVASASNLPGIRLLTMHTLGGAAMMRAARDAAAGRPNRPSLLGVTVLTSMDANTLKEVGLSGSTGTRALALATLAQEAGLDGVVASTHEAEMIRAACGPDFLIVVPGVRPANASTHDQARVATPAEAVMAGADYLVIGRPITGASDAADAAHKIAAEIAAAHATKSDSRAAAS